MKLSWSPEQIAIRLPIDHPKETTSYEAIYHYIYAQIYRGGNWIIKEGGKDLRPYLVRRHTRRQKKASGKLKNWKKIGQITFHWRQTKRSRQNKKAGHFEDDTIVSRQNSVLIKSINERTSGVVFLGQKNDGTSEKSTRVVCERLSAISPSFRKTLIRDQGT